MNEDIFDVVNERDEIIGREPRSVVHARELRHRAVHVLVFNAVGQLFLQKRSMAKDNDPGCVVLVITGRGTMETVMQATDRNRLLVPVPFAIMEWYGAMLGLVPQPLLTRDQVRMLRSDNTAEHGLPGLSDLGIVPTAISAIVPGYLGRYRRGGQFNRQSTAV